MNLILTRRFIRHKVNLFQTISAGIQGNKTETILILSRKSGEFFQCKNRAVPANVTVTEVETGINIR